MKKHLFPIAFLALTNQLSAQLSPTENYIQSVNCLNDDCTKKSETVIYYDGLGRPKQIVNVKATPTGKDLVTPVTYDGFGRQTKDILPTPISSLNSAIHSGITNESTANSYYGVTNAYSEKEIENSPLDRVLQQGHAGDSWKLGSGHTQTMQYEANSANEVLKFATNTNWVNGATSSAISLATDTNSENGHYKAAQLYKTTVTDEDGNPVIQFTNGQGQTLLIRKTEGTQNIDTYYVYNGYNQKAFIIPPKAVKQIKANNNTVTQAILDDLCYQYSYDGRDRQVEKKLPGKGREYFVFDKADRLILHQDSVLKSQGKWLITKYDMFGRVAYTGIYNGGSNDRASLQNQIKDIVVTETRNTGGFVQNGTRVYYSNAHLSPLETVLTINYYNTYPFDDSFTPAVPTSVLGQLVRADGGQNADLTTNALQTASYVKNIEDDSWTRTYNYYDSRARVIATKTINHLGGYTNIDLKLDFTGLVEESYTYHKRTANDTEVKVKERFVYDNQNRLVKQYHQVDNLQEELLAENSYNEIGQLVNKKTGNNTGTPLQSIDYAYNIRGWMTSVNNPNNPSSFNGKLFGLELKYNNPDASNSSFAKYNGNIAQSDWKTAVDGTLRRYTYQYDKLDRMLSAIYSKPENTVVSTNAYNEVLQYDENGNILHIERYGGIDGNQAQKIDDIALTIEGNRLIKAQDTSSNPSGYPSGGNIIAYDINGNMTSHKDENINKISYNHLNLPVNVNMVQGGGLGMMGEGNIVDFKYRADGVKVEKNTNFVNPYTQNLTNVNYLDGFQYERKYNKSNTAQQASDTGYLLQFIPTGEGYYDYQKKRYVYNYADQVGNIRLAYYRNANGNGEVDKETNYYPFGLEHSGYNGLISKTPTYQYGFQGQEKQQETGWSSYRWRNSIPKLGRFFNVDPLSEKYNEWSTYAFSGNRLIDARELEGLEPLKINSTTKNLVIVNQGWVRANPPDGATQSQNFAKTNKDGGIDYSGIGIINNLNSAKTQVGVFGSSSTENTKNDILSSIKSFREQSPDGKLIMVGHSRGADNLIELVNEHSNVKVDLLFTLDIAAGWDSDNIPSNVKTAVNYYNKNDGFMGSSIGGEDIEAIDSSKTKILNVPVSASHTEIDNKYRYNAYNAVVKELNKPEEKKNP